MSSATYIVDTVNDDTDEDNGVLSATVLAGAGYAPGTPDRHDVAVADNDDPAVSFSAASYRVAEGDAVSVTLNIVRPRSATTAVGISCTDGTADSADYSGCPSSVTIPASAASYSFTVQTTMDTTNESDETFTISIGSVPAGVATGSPSSATVVVFDNGGALCENCVWITGGAASSRWSMEAAYGFPAFGGRWTGSPHVGLGLATGARDYSLGWRLTPEDRSAANVSFGLKATRRESAAQAPEHTAGVEITARW